MSDLDECNACGSKNTHIVKFRISTGYQLRYQCKDCGYVNVRSLKHTLNDDKFPEVDIVARANYYETQQKKMQQRRLENQIKREKEREDYFDNTLKNYYNSYDWKIKKEQRYQWNKILNNGLCERCNSKKATCVHHRGYDAYEHLGKEHPLELECLCEECHQMLHPHMQYKWSIYEDCKDVVCNGAITSDEYERRIKLILGELESA